MAVLLTLLVAGAGVALWVVARSGSGRNGGMMTGMTGMMTKSSSGTCPSKQGDASSPTIAGFRFCPGTVRIAAGTVVRWTNGDSAPHTVTSRAGGQFDSGTFARGRSWSHRFEQAGTFSYYCTLHPWMEGTVEVTSG